jgi:triosephosphate isomerase
LIEKQSGKREAVLLEQLNEGLQDVQLAAGQKILIAYEPVWVIGSGQAVDPDEAERVQAMIKEFCWNFFLRGRSVTILGFCMAVALIVQMLRVF